MHALAAPILTVLTSFGLNAPAPEAHAFAAEQAAAAFDLYRQLAHEPGNVVFSPWSLLRALAMAHEGAAGETAAELERALHLPPGGAGARFAELARAMEPRYAGARFTLELAASMWAAAGEPIDAAYLERLKSAYASELIPIDFREPSVARDAINRWVRDHTRGRIPELVPEGHPARDSALVLVDCAYFKASWLDEFSKHATRLASFLTHGGEVSAPTMHRTGYMGYAETEQAQVVELAYSGGMSMLIVLPKERSAAALQRLLAHESYALWTAEIAAREVALALPKFRFEFGADCVPALRRLGIALALDRERADFSRIGAGPYFVGAVQHKAVIDVDEAGSEVAAATEVGVRCGAAMNPPKPVSVDADHPFLFVIRHPESGTVLFMGRVDDPTRG